MMKLGLFALRRPTRREGDDFPVLRPGSTVTRASGVRKISP